LQDDHVDVAVRIGLLPDSRLRATRLGEVRRVVCASPQYLAAQGEPLTPAEITSHHCISFTGLELPDRWGFQTHGVEGAVPIHARLAVNTAEAAIDAAISGLGLTRVLSYQIAAACDAGHLMTVLKAYEPPSVPIHLVFDGQGALPLKLRAFLDFAAPRIRERMVAQAG
jgi:DNA-binding transcriptional LysR family regulator